MGSASLLPLCVDLDGTLIRSDSFFESLALMLRKRPWGLLQLPLWLLHGKANAKRHIAQVCLPNPTTLPYNRVFLQFLQHEKSRGRHLILITASDVGIAQKVADELGLFDEVIGSDGTLNVSGKRKLRFLEDRFGKKKFAYAGNSRADIPVWHGAGEVLIVNAPRWLRRRMRQHMTSFRCVQAPNCSEECGAELCTGIGREFSDRRSPLLELFRAMRPYQWLKNVLVFVPAFTAHQIESLDVLQASVLMFIAMSLCASGAYLLNDVLDIPSDREHPRKCMRPLAAGHLPIPLALGCIPVLLIAGLWIAAQLPMLSLAIVSLYVALTCLYSLMLKQIVVLDIVCLTLLYTLRIVAGTVATQVPSSAWLLTFSLFLFMSLALLKRYTELILLVQNSNRRTDRGYVCEDAPLLSQLGTASGYISILVFTLYINSPQVTVLYRQPELLWLICPILLYFISRMWFVAYRGRMHDDPIIFTLKDPSSLAIVFGAMVTVLASS